MAFRVDTVQIPVGSAATPSILQLPGSGDWALIRSVTYVNTESEVTQLTGVSMFLQPPDGSHQLASMWLIGELIGLPGYTSISLFNSVALVLTVTIVRGTGLYRPHDLTVQPTADQLIVTPRAMAGFNASTYKDITGGIGPQHVIVPAVSNTNGVIVLAASLMAGSAGTTTEEAYLEALFLGIGGFEQGLLSAISCAGAVLACLPKQYFLPPAAELVYTSTANARGRVDYLIL